MDASQPSTSIEHSSSRSARGAGFGNRTADADTTQRFPLGGSSPKVSLQGFLGRRLIRGKEHSSPLEPAPCIAGTGHFVPGAVQDDRLVLATIHPRDHHRVASAAHTDDRRRRPSEAAREIVVQIALVPILTSFLLGTFFRAPELKIRSFALPLLARRWLISVHRQSPVQAIPKALTHA